MKQICHKPVVHLTAWDAWSKWAAPFPIFLVLGHNKWAALLPVYYFGSRQQVFGKKIAPTELRTVNQEVLGWSSTTTLRDLSCSWQVFLLFVPFLVNCGPSPGSITTYWALSCDVLRHIVTSSIAARHRDEVDRLYVSCGGVLAGDQRLRDFFNPLQPCGG
jgi:hypothetical protein